MGEVRAEDRYEEACLYACSDVINTVEVMLKGRMFQSSERKCPGIANDQLVVLSGSAGPGNSASHLCSRLGLRCCCISARYGSYRHRVPVCVLPDPFAIQTL